MKIGLKVLLGALAVAVVTIALLAHTNHRIYAVQTGSMSPNIPSKSLVVVEVGKYHLGQPISFHRGNEVVTHRLVGLNPDGTYVTKGDGNNAADATTVSAQDVIGGVIASQRELGFWWVYATSPLGAASIGVSLLLLYLIWGLFDGGALTPTGSQRLDLTRFVGQVILGAIPEERDPDGLSIEVSRGVRA